MRVLRPKPGPRCCGTCRHYDPIRTDRATGEHFGVCRKRAPVVLADAALTAAARWPEVALTMRCGDFERAYEPPFDEI